MKVLATVAVLLIILARVNSVPLESVRLWCECFLMAKCTNHSVNVHVLCMEVVMHVVCSVTLYIILHGILCCMYVCINMATTVF